MSLKALFNLSDSTVRDVEPWDEQYRRPNIATKEKFTKWQTNPKTQHCFVSAYEGVNPDLRIVKKTNPAIKMRGIIADYDCRYDLDKVPEQLANTLPPHLLPNCYHDTFSGGVRLIWMFDEPVNAYSPKVHKVFMNTVVRELKLKKLLPGLDDNIYDWHHYFEAGAEWHVLNESTIDCKYPEAWFYEASKKITAFDTDSAVPRVPLEEIKKLVDEQFPGKWKGPFELNARGARFWDPAADNVSASVVKENGMVCFTGDQSFVSWTEIFGASALSEYQTDRVRGIVKDVFFDLREYWKKGEDGLWHPMKKPDFQLWLKGSNGLTSDGDSLYLSEVEEATLYVNEYKRVHVAVPLVHRPTGLINFQGKKLLNTSSVRCLQPVEGDFPFLERFLGIDGGDGFFAEDLQLHVFLTWLQRYYQSSLIQEPVLGQLMVIAGPPEAGKTFLSNVVVSGLVGGHTDASRFLMGKDNFSGHVLEHALWTIDDGSAAYDVARRGEYSSMLKKMTVNSTFEYSEKYRASYMVPFRGRCLLTCNLDSESLRVIPDADHSLLDKMHLLKAQEREFIFPENLLEIIRMELPGFAYWLINEYEPPEELLVANRFGMESYHEASLLHVAKESTQASAFLEVLEIFFSEKFREDNKSGVWEGSSSELLKDMNENDDLRILLKDYGPRNIGRLMAQLKNQGAPVEQTRSKTGRRWRINRDILNSFGSLEDSEVIELDSEGNPF